MPPHLALLEAALDERDDIVGDGQPPKLRLLVGLDGGEQLLDALLHRQLALARVRRGEAPHRAAALPPPPRLRRTSCCCTQPPAAPRKEGAVPGSGALGLESRPRALGKSPPG